MAIAESVLKDVETLLKKYLNGGSFKKSLNMEDEGYEDDEGDEFGEMIEAHFFVKKVLAEGDKTILFDLDSDVSCPPHAQEEAEMLINEEWVPDVIAKVLAKVDGDFDLVTRDGEISWEEE